MRGFSATRTLPLNHRSPTPTLIASIFDSAAPTPNPADRMQSPSNPKPSVKTPSNGGWEQPSFASPHSVRHPFFPERASRITAAGTTVEKKLGKYQIIVGQ